MGAVKIPYYVVKKGRGYWQPTSAMRQDGFRSIRCGPDGPQAWAIAEEWNRRWQLSRRGLEVSEQPAWPRGSLGEAFERLRQTSQWQMWAPRTREDWLRGQAMLSPVFGTVAPSTIKFEHIDQFYAALMATKGVDFAYRAIKHYRRLWVKMAAMGYCRREADPSAALRRINPTPRTEVWTYDEVRTLVKTAIRAGYSGLACIIAVAWDTQFSPGDVRILNSANLSSERGRNVFRTRRRKTGTPSIGTLSRFTQKLMISYLEVSPPSAELPMFRHRRGGAYSKDGLTHDFAKVRDLSFPGDTRKLMDLRRSGAVEAAAGGVDPNALAAKMANTINSSRQLQKTYQPVSAAAVMLADAARLRGRKRIKSNKMASSSRKPSVGPLTEV